MAEQPNPSVWYAALAAEVGIIWQTSDPHTAKMKFYEIRKSLKDADLETISIVVMDEGLWFVKRRENETQGDLPPTEGNVEPSGG